MDMETLAAYVKARRDLLGLSATALAAIDAELATLPEAPDPAVYARLGAYLTSVRAVIDALDDDDLRPLIAELGVVVVAGDGVTIRYQPGVSDFIPAPFVSRL